MKKIAIYNTDEQAVTLSEVLNLPLVTSNTDTFTYLLQYSDNFLQLQSHKDKKFKPLYVDFVHGKSEYRRVFPGKELLAKAIGYKHFLVTKIIDATAGLGRDAFVLASLGCDVTLIERSPILAALLQDGLLRASKVEATHNIVQRMHLLIGDAQSLLPDLKSDVIYLDPMYPHRQKSALVKKEMRILRDLVGADVDAANLLTIALQCNVKRVVVKRPRLAENSIAIEPNFSSTGKNSRFDVYLKGTHNV